MKQINNNNNNKITKPQTRKYLLYVCSCPQTPGTWSSSAWNKRHPNTGFTLSVNSVMPLVPMSPPQCSCCPPYWKWPHLLSSTFFPCFLFSTYCYLILYVYLLTYLLLISTPWVCCTLFCCHIFKHSNNV